jgi:hypothetical protein
MLRRRPRSQPQPEPQPSPPTGWLGAVDVLIAAGFTHRQCPALCRRKADHRHLGNAAADLIVSPAVTP